MPAASSLGDPVHRDGPGSGSRARPFGQVPFAGAARPPAVGTSAAPGPASTGPAIALASCRRAPARATAGPHCLSTVMLAAYFVDDSLARVMQTDYEFKF